MKTNFFLIVIITTLSVLTLTFNSANAQRRSYNREGAGEKSEEKKENGQLKEKSTSRAYESEIKNRQNTSNERRTVQRKKEDTPSVKSAPAAADKRGSSQSRENNAYRERQPEKNQQPVSAQRRTPDSNRSNLRNTPERNQRESFRNGGPVRNGTAQGRAVSQREIKEHNHKLYRVDNRDSRYEPVRTFKGSKNHWKPVYATHYIHYTKHNEDYYRHYNYKKHLHWDHRWETYLWNVNSWRDYYYGYHPYSYRFHKHYFYHPVYGHVIRKFGFKPDYFVHNHIRYYNFNGHFFRHFPGVGFVLADMPFGLVFQKVPGYAERVYVNGFLYFRVGNLFFEKNPHGFALIHYPERYYALDDDFYNGGYYQETDYYIYR